MKHILMVGMVLLGFSAMAQVIPQERLYQWSKAGLTSQIQEPNTVLDITAYGAVGDGNTENSVALSSALGALNGEAGVIYFPSGEYYFEQRFVLHSGVVLRSAGADSTTLLFDLGGSNSDLISIRGSISSTEIAIPNGASKGSSYIILESATSLEVGDYIRLADNDSSVITSLSWAAKSTGQVVEISAISGDTAYLSSVLRRDYLAINNPKVKKLNPIKDVSVENLKIKRLDATSGQTDNINIAYAVNCRVKCIESENCNFAHVGINTSSNVLVEGSYFHHAHAYGGGGQGYGVVLQYTSGECLVENNIFNHLRHSMLLQAGANGNVLAYNYSHDPFWSDPFLPSNSAGDAVLHGNYVYANLFEGNSIQNIVIDDSHGINGPHNMFFRNRASLYGIFMNTGSPTNNQGFIGNEMTGTGTFQGMYSLAGTGHFEHGNNKLGATIPANTSSIAYETLFKDVMPDWYNSNSNWPPIGYPNTLSQYSNEAEYRFNSQLYTACASAVVTEVAYIKEGEVSVYPNPTGGIVYVNFSGRCSVNVIGADGRVVGRYANQRMIDISSLSSGVYTFQIYDESGAVEHQKVIKQ